MLDLGVPIYTSPFIPFDRIIFFDKTAAISGFYVSDLLMWVWKMKKATIPDAGSDHYEEDLAAILWG